MGFLIRDLVVKVERREDRCGELLEYIQQLTYFAKMPQLQKIALEWVPPTRHTEESMDDDGGESACSAAVDTEQG